MLLIIILANEQDKVTALKAIESGAQDYFLKDSDDPLFLTSAIRYAIKRKQLQMLKQEFNGTIAHEINTPIAIVREGISQVVDGLHGDLNNDQKRQLSIALKNVDWLNGGVFHRK